MPDKYHIRIKGHLTSQWSDWFDGMTIINQPNGEAWLEGELPDQSALYGLLTKIRDLGLPLLMVRTSAADGPANTE